MKRSPVIGIKNHRDMIGILRSIAVGVDLSWFEGEVGNISRSWYRLALNQLRIARSLAENSRRWRSTVSRSYYAAYNLSKCIRYFCAGTVKFDGTDHQDVGNLPDDFPNRTYWATFLTDLRKDRNLADYEPWETVRGELSKSPSQIVGEVGRFKDDTRAYLKGKGLT